MKRKLLILLKDAKFLHKIGSLRLDYFCKVTKGRKISEDYQKHEEKLGESLGTSVQAFTYLLFFLRLICLFESQNYRERRGRERDREKSIEKSYNYWFTSQTAARARTWPSENKEPGALASLHVTFRGSNTWAIFCCFYQAVSEEQPGHKLTRMWDASVTGSRLSSCATMPTPM